MKIVIREWLKTPRAIAIMALTILVSAVKSWSVVQCSIYIPRVVAGGSLTSNEWYWLILVSAVAVVMDVIYIMMESRSYRIFYTETIGRFTRAIVDARYELYTKYSLAHITHVQGFIQDSSTVGKMCIRISSNVIYMILNVGAIILFAPQVVLPIAGMYAIMAVCIWPLYRKIGLCDKKAKDLMKERDQILENAVYGFTEVRVNNTQDYEYDRVRQKNRNIYSMLNVKAHWNGLLMLGASGMDGLGTLVVIIYVIHMIASGQLTVAAGLSVVTMAGSLLGGLMNILDMVDSCSEITSRASNWEELMDDALDVPRDGTIHMAELRNSIEVKDIDFTYGDTGSVLNGCTMSIEAGTKVGICGRSGDGKSTLLKLLCKFYDPDFGAIEFDGVNIDDIKTSTIYDQISVVSQEITIFPGSIYENITYGRPNVTEHAVIEACRKAELYDFVMKLPQQLNTEVGPRGIKLSGGQRQRIALARMFLRDPSIIILDEATSALDNSSERLVQRAIEQMHGKTIIMVAHRLSTIENCDEIFVMSNGAIAEHGTPEELKIKGGLYAKMLNASVEE